MTPVFAAHRRDKNNVCAKWRTALFTGLLHYVRNDSRSRISVIASERSDAWQSSL